MDPSGIDEVSQLIDAAWRADGTRPFSDHLWLDLREGGRHGFAGIIARDSDSDSEHDHVQAYCQVSRGHESWSIDLVVHPHHRYDTLEIAPDLISAALDIVASEGGGHVHWWVFEPSNLHYSLAESAGLRAGRRLIQMRRDLPLPTELVATINEFDTKPFRIGIDEHDWIAVNNAAFADHPEQGGWTNDILALRETEPWFDPQGFLMHWDNDTLLGFCWTKVHTETEPHMGEIYVIATAPTASRKGLGRALTIAGLAHLATHQVPIAMLYVASDNAPAISLYNSLGFTRHHSELAFVGDVAACEALAATK